MNKKPEKEKSPKIKKSVDIAIFAKFFGLWLMNEDIPLSLYKKVSENIEVFSKQLGVNIYMSIKMILGAPNPKDRILRGLVLKTLT